MRMQKKKSGLNLPDIKKLSKEIERWSYENGKGKDRIRYYKDEIKQLGGKFKKSHIPFKHGLLLEKHRKKKKEIEKQINANIGIYKKHLKKRK